MHMMRPLRFFLQTLASVAAIAGFALPAAGQTRGENGRFRWETVLTGNWESVRIGAGKVARTRCITAFEQLLAEPEYRGRLPETAEKLVQPVSVPVNPNNLQYQSEYYIFVGKEGSEFYELRVYCNVEATGPSGMRFTLAVEGVPLRTPSTLDLEDTVRTHMAWIRRRMRAIVE